MLSPADNLMPQFPIDHDRRFDTLLYLNGEVCVTDPIGENEGQFWVEP
jgi:hypothetical protein